MMWQYLYDTGSEICNHTLNHNLGGINWVIMAIAGYLAYSRTR